MGKRYLIVGSGLFGSVCARELTDAGHSCQVIEKRDHIGGNCYTRKIEEAGCHEHVYGPHIFHTNSTELWNYIRRFTEFNHFSYRPRVNFKGSYYSFPINLMTLNQLWGVVTPEAAKAKLAEVREDIPDPANLEEWCLSQVGRELYETFVRGYTAKQWHHDPKDLPASLIKRLPIRLRYDDNYFNDQYQGIPKEGYTKIFERMLEGIPVEFGVDFLEDRDSWLEKFDHVIYTGSPDSFFGYSEGPLEYRSLRFERELLDTPDFQGVAAVNYTEEQIPYTRIVEHKHFDLSFSKEKTLITKEYPSDWKLGDIEFYPVNTGENQAVFAKYKSLMKEMEGKVVFGGRLGEYRYYDMHQVIAAALKRLKVLLG
ncbi:UDP-galactopyranose mutase [Pelagicoccus albus]|uniref:UDP-galactopyranose mutase n=1 Tax=Pelagicoccus albus TaxID=415222 RepID=A0A7X1B7E2_9BACT|nr:UDP-galactopyranose mutase [Pelagicoccus albus]MBC2606946.1 UDP-galactopyranose mutase [Pelagicoccus albus]